MPDSEASAQVDDDPVQVVVPENIWQAGLVAVEFPLAIKPTEAGKTAALAMVGGIEEVTRVAADEEQTLKLHARREDPLCRPLTAQRNASDASTFVLKVRRRRVIPRVSKGDAPRPAGGAGDGESQRESGDGGGGTDSSWSIASVELVGAVHTLYTFHSLSDAQFVSCRPKDNNTDEKIGELIAEAASRVEPLELVPPTFLPSLPRVSVASREAKIQRRERKQNEGVKLDKEEIQVYHRFGEDTKYRTREGDNIIKEAKAIALLEDQLDAKWGSGKKKVGARHNRPSRMRKGISGFNEVREQELMVVSKIVRLFEAKPMNLMKELDSSFHDQATWLLRELVPAVSYYYVNGPWRSRWVRFGYRPEDVPLARFDQLLEFRLSASQLREWTEALQSIEECNPSSEKGGITTHVTGTPVDDHGKAEGQAGDRRSVGGQSSATRFEDGGILPDVRLTSEAKGRFASKVVLNGETLSARNRHIIGESPFRVVQEIALSSARLDVPNIRTGWWPASVVHKMRQATLEGINECIKAKQEYDRYSKTASSGSIAGARTCVSDVGETPPGEPNKTLADPGNISGGQDPVGERATDGESRQKVGGAEAGNASTSCRAGIEDSVLDQNRFSHTSGQRRSLTKKEFAQRVATDEPCVTVVAAVSLPDTDEIHTVGGGAAHEDINPVSEEFIRHGDTIVSSEHSFGRSADARASTGGGKRKSPASRFPWISDVRKVAQGHRGVGQGGHGSAVDMDRALVPSSSGETSGSDDVRSSDLVDESEDGQFAGEWSSGMASSDEEESGPLDRSARRHVKDSTNPDRVLPRRDARRGHGEAGSGEKQQREQNPMLNVQSDDEDQEHIDVV